ncbi:Crp/Fnr family transcriptional regulator [Portibacter lacus]|uniref:Cyclic nucleotide-binding protein n=1 Tax=Portibacter lacus TaxID=1099794 RepID=A0AA37WIB5_9BACT|nr:Crp/Fnr family transcriptional regulator [Portibacter lacus]GLR19590.1 cyclic nucleotide-binding protein [Portibacter lacus]
MIEKLIAYFSKFQPLAEEEKNILREGTEISIVKSGVILLKEGGIPKDNYFLIRGCVRQYYLKDGEENTSNFFTEEEWILPFTSVENNGISKYFLECMEDSYLVIANDEQGNDFLEKFPRFQKISQLILEKEIVRQQNELAKYINQTPEQRYFDLKKNRPDLLSRAPQYQIASYIGVKPESLSRIRKRIMKYLD